MSERGEFEKRLLLPYAELLWRRYAYTHRKDDGRFPSRNEYIVEMLDEAHKDFLFVLQNYDCITGGIEGALEHCIKKWFGSAEK